jgi:uncharacterized protein YbjT (DUF2867 family)
MILITAPTSTNGRQLVDDLIAYSAPLRLIVRDASSLSPEVRDAAEVVEGSHGDPEAIDRACEGIDTVFWLAPNLVGAETVDASFSGFSKPAAEAFARRGVQRVVCISAIGRGSELAGRAGLVTASLAMEDLISASVPSFRAITSATYMHNLLGQVEAMKGAGAFFMTLKPDLRSPWVASNDVAARALELLLDDSWEGKGHVACLGPSDITPVEIAATISDVVGQTVAYQQVPDAGLKENLVSAGYSDAMADAVIEMFDAKNEGLDNFEPREHEATTPTSFREWCEEAMAPAFARA